MKRRTLIAGGLATAALGSGVALSFAEMGSSTEYADAMTSLRSPLAGDADIKGVVRYATLAANGHNTQPWRFRIAEGQICIVPDFSRRTPVVDPDDHHLYVNLGCAAANLALAANAAGLPGEIQFDPAGDGSIVYSYVHGEPQPSDLFGAIVRRHSARINFDGRAVPAADLDLLSAAGVGRGVQVRLITERSEINRARDLVIAGNSAQLSNPAFVSELKSWMRFNPRSALASGDGLYTAGSGNLTLPTWLGAAMFDFAFTADAENDKYARQLDTSSGLVVFCGETEDHASWIQVGRACQRFALQATALGMKTSFVNQPVEVASLRADLSALAGMDGKRPDILMRFGYGPDLPMSPRRLVENVIES